MWSDVKPDKTWEPVYLVQRLEAPRVRHTAPAATDKGITAGHGAACVFSFGGGSSGHTEIANALLGLIYTYDYMGAAEYEFGAVAAAVSAIREHGMANNLACVAVECTIPTFAAISSDEVKKGFYSIMPNRRRKPVTATAWAIARRDWVDQGLPQAVVRVAAEDIKATAAGAFPPSRDAVSSQTPTRGFRDAPNLWRALIAPAFAKEFGIADTTKVCRTIGGLDCTNGTAFFTSAEATWKFAMLMGIHPGSLPDSCRPESDDICAFVSECRRIEGNKGG